jgi:ABC-type transport system involved in Fe-S cluster assembly fused permease/ATPase subunit
MMLSQPDGCTVLFENVSFSYDDKDAATRTEALTNAQCAINALVSDKTVITIAHHLKTVRGADRIIVLNNAGVVEEGRHQELTAGWRMKAAA